MKLWKLNLCLFGEGGGEGGGEGAAASAAGGEGAAAQPATEAQQEQPAERTPEEKAKAFEELIKGEYAKEFSDRTNGIIAKRFKETKGLEAQMEKLKPVLSALSAKYGETDHDKLIAAVQADKSFYQDAADAEGMTVEQYQERETLREKARAYDQMLSERDRLETERKAYAQWDAQSQELKKVYPGFDFAAECQNEATGHTFIKLLGQGVPVETAYKAIHADELLSGAIQTAVNTTRQRTMETIRAQGMRPDENGVGGSVATQMKTKDPAAMTKAEREEMVRRARRGERITFTE